MSPHQTSSLRSYFNIYTGDAKIMEFRPSWDEFKDFNAFVRKIEQIGAHASCGIAKVVPPPEFQPIKNWTRTDAIINNYVIKSPVRETIEGQKGVYCKANERYQKTMKVSEFRVKALSKEFNKAPPLEGKDMFKYYWENITDGEPIYGADTEGTFMDSDCDVWNVAKLGTILDELKAQGTQIKGVNTPYLYFGMWKTTFPWHAEDVDLYSINYLHFGAPKYWYAIPASAASKFERLMAQLFPSDYDLCRAFLRHKLSIVHPAILKEHGIPYGTCVQNANEFILTFPQGYHMGFNAGYNCAESTNFASDRWLDFAKNIVPCECSSYSVRFDINPMMQRYRPEEYENWRLYWFDKEIRPHPRTYKRLRTKALAHLWASNPPDIIAEQQWNERQARESPHCAVCSYFERPFRRKLLDVPPRRSRVLSSELCFAKNPQTPPSRQADVEDLLTCDCCLVTVHPSCYAVMPQTTGAWRCQRCTARSEQQIQSTSCVLCELRGGAYVRCVRGNEDGWVHIICAIFSRRAIFDNPGTRLLVRIKPLSRHQSTPDSLVRLHPQYVEAVEDDAEHNKFECELCQGRQESLLKCELCYSICGIEPYFHTTCARASGFFFEPRDFPLVTGIVCSLHATHPDVDIVRGTLERGAKVVVSINDENPQRGVVLSCKIEEFAFISYRDGQYVDDTPFEDIISCECESCDGKAHQPGAEVVVDWPPEGQQYNAFFRRITQTINVKVHLRWPPNAKPIDVRRKFVFAEGDAMPSDVIEKLCQADREYAINVGTPAVVDPSQGCSGNFRCQSSEVIITLDSEVSS